VHTSGAPHKAAHIGGRAMTSSAGRKWTRTCRSLPVSCSQALGFFPFPRRIRLLA
jgi:hypothetical protein